MIKYGLIALLLLPIAGCKTVEYRDVYKPVLYCPAPPQVNKPELKIDQLTDEDKRDPGKVAKYIAASIVQLEQHIIKLEEILSEYKRISEENGDYGHQGNDK